MPWAPARLSPPSPTLPREGEGAFAIEIHQGVSAAELKVAKSGTVRSSRLECPHCGQSTAMTAIRGDRRGGGASDYGLRQWENSDLVPRPDDTFQERLYCIRWRLPDLADLLWAEQREHLGALNARPVPDWVPLDRAIDGLAALLDALRARDWLAEDARLDAAGAELAALRAAKAPNARIDAQNKVLIALIAAQAERSADIKTLVDRLPGSLYRAIEPDDLQREALVLGLLRERFEDWQTKGYIPSRRITPGDKTNEPIRTRGWTIKL